LILGKDADGFVFSGLAVAAAATASDSGIVGRDAVDERPIDANVYKTLQ
jgi:hypothetical protein